MEISRQCEQCSSAVFDGARFCSECGTKLVVDGDESRIAIAKDFVTGSLSQAEATARDLLKNKGVQKVAGGAALGAGVAVFIPFVGLAAGAMVGAAVVAYKQLTKD